MISLTRKIRRHFRPAQQKCTDRTRYLMKYFHYSGGEILLVVLGVMIAFQVNAWNLARSCLFTSKQKFSPLHYNRI